MIRENNVTKIGVISDTHIPASVQTFPPAVFRIFSGSNFIIHCGDAVDESAVNQLESIAPVYAVKGNMDRYASDRPEKLVIQVNEKYVLCVSHGHGSPFGIKDSLISEFSYLKPDLLLFGHTHFPEISAYGGYRFLNPGSACCGRGGMNSAALINITSNGISAEIIKL